MYKAEVSLFNSFVPGPILALVVSWTVRFVTKFRVKNCEHRICALNSPCNDEWNGTNIFEIGPILSEKLLKMRGNRQKILSKREPRRTACRILTSLYASSWRLFPCYFTLLYATIYYVYFTSLILRAVQSREWKELPWTWTWPNEIKQSMWKQSYFLSNLLSISTSLAGSVTTNVDRNRVDISLVFGDSKNPDLFGETSFSRDETRDYFDALSDHDGGHVVVTIGDFTLQGDRDRVTIWTHLL